VVGLETMLLKSVETPVGLCFSSHKLFTFRTMWNFSGKV